MMTYEQTHWQAKIPAQLSIRLQEAHGLGGEEATQLIADLTRFLWLASTAGEPLAPSRRIDKAWHEFLEIGDAYSAFCGDCLGKQVRHVPWEVRPDARAICSSCDSGGESPTAETPNVEQMIGRTLELARSKFGSLSENWNYNRR